MKLLVAFICIVTINVVSSVVITKMSTLANKTFLSYETDQMLFSISNQTEKIRNEICSSVNEISSSLDRIFNLMKELKKDINEFQSMVNSTNCNNTNNNLTEVIPSKMKINKLLFVINNMNAIKADLYKINGITANPIVINPSNDDPQATGYPSIPNLLYMASPKRGKANANKHLIKPLPAYDEAT